MPTEIFPHGLGAGKPRGLVAAIALAVIAYAAPASADPPKLNDPPAKAEFKTYTSADGHFQADFPGKPQESKEETDTPVGKAKYNFLGVDVKSLDESYSIVYSDVGDKVGGNFNVQKALDGSRDGIVKSLGAKLVSEQKLSVLGLPARDLTLEKSDEPKTTLRWRILYENARQYQLIVAASGHGIDEERVNRFFDSFKLTDGKPTEAKLSDAKRSDSK